MMAVIPNFLNLKDDNSYDETLINSEIFNILPSVSNNQSDLNTSNSQQRYTCNNENKFFRLGSNRSGFRIHLSYLTKTNANNDRNANATLSNNPWPHLFSSMSLKLGGNIVENIQQPGIALDMMNLLSSIEYKNSNGQQSGIIFDTGNGGSDDKTVSNAAITAGAATAVNFTTTNPDFNQGHFIRKRLYNYPVANDNTVRSCELFIPLHNIFSFCKEFDKVLKYISFEITLVRADREQVNKSILCSDGTSVVLGNADSRTTGIISQILEIEYYTVSPEIATKLDNQLSKQIRSSYLAKDMINRTTNALTFDYNSTNNSTLRFVFIGCKGINDVSNQNTATANYQLFRNADIKSVQVNLDGVYYPNVQYDTNFLMNRFSNVYRDFVSACEALNGNECSTSMREFRDLYPLFAVDLTAQHAKIANKSTNISIKIVRNTVGVNNNADTVRNPLDIEIFILQLFEKNTNRLYT